MSRFIALSLRLQFAFAAATVPFVCSADPADQPDPLWSLRVFHGEAGGLDARVVANQFSLPQRQFPVASIWLQERVVVEQGHDGHSRAVTGVNRYLLEIGENGEIAAGPDLFLRASLLRPSMSESSARTFAVSLEETILPPVDKPERIIVLPNNSGLVVASGREQTKVIDVNSGAVVREFDCEVWQPTYSDSHVAMLTRTPDRQLMGILVLDEYGGVVREDHWPSGEGAYRLTLSSENHLYYYRHERPAVLHCLDLQSGTETPLPNAPFGVCLPSKDGNYMLIIHRSDLDTMSVWDTRDACLLRPVSRRQVDGAIVTGAISTNGEVIVVQYQQREALNSVRTNVELLDRGLSTTRTIVGDTSLQGLAIAGDYLFVGVPDVNIPAYAYFPTSGILVFGLSENDR